ncbi:MAG: hypothetical protein ACI8PV_001719 [Dinoroseobacter sp.]|jgi:hypothetical protein
MLVSAWLSFRKTRGEPWPITRAGRPTILHAACVVPQIISVGLPVHAQCSSEEAGKVECVSPRMLIVNANNLVWTDFARVPNQASF